MDAADPVGGDGTVDPGVTGWKHPPGTIDSGTLVAEAAGQPDRSFVRGRHEHCEAWLDHRPEQHSAGRTLRRRLRGARCGAGRRRRRPDADRAGQRLGGDLRRPRPRTPARRDPGPGGRARRRPAGPAASHHGPTGRAPRPRRRTAPGRRGHADVVGGTPHGRTAAGRGTRRAAGARRRPRRPAAAGRLSGTAHGPPRPRGRRVSRPWDPRPGRGRPRPPPCPRRRPAPARRPRSTRPVRSGLPSPATSRPARR